MSVYLKTQTALTGNKGKPGLLLTALPKNWWDCKKIEAHDTVNERSMKTVGTVKTQTAPGIG